MGCKNILIIEDDEAVRQSLQDVLEMRGYHPITAADGREGIAQLKANADNPCVILLDIMMPGMNGWQFLDFQRSMSQYAGIPVIVCSAFKETAKALNPVAFIPKPIELKALVSAIEAFCS